MAALYRFAEPIFWILVVVNAVCFAIVGLFMALGLQRMANDRLTALINAFDRWWLPIYNRLIHWMKFLIAR